MVGARVWRQVLALLDDDSDSAEAVLNEIGDCAACLRRVDDYLASAFAGFATRLGGKDLAISVTQAELAKALDELDELRRK